MKVIFVVTEDWYFWSHRLPMARAAVQAGMQVGVATRVGAFGDKIKAEGFKLHDLHWSRKSMSAPEFLLTIWQLFKIFRQERPAIVHNVSMKPVIVGGVAAFCANVPHVINALTGLGYLFTSRRIKAKVIRFVLHPLIKFILTREASTTLLQNSDNQVRMREIGYDNANTVIIRGSGVDIDHYKAQPVMDNDVVCIAFVGRIIETKGVSILMQAHRLLRDVTRCKLLLVGEPDAENPDTIPREVIVKWASEPDVEWLGHCGDIREIWRRADIAILPSTVGEGLPKSLLEAAACARPLIATDVSGCREIALNGRNAIIVPPNDVIALANAMKRLCLDPKLRKRFGIESRRLVETDMSQAHVMQKTVQLYTTIQQSLSKTSQVSMRCL